MVKDIFYLKNSTKDILFSSITRTTLLISGVIFGFYILFNLFAFIKLVDIVDIESDKKIIHELEHVDKFIDYKDDSLFFYSNREFEEEEFLLVSENSYFLQIYDTSGKILFISSNVLRFGSIPLKFPPLKSGITKDNIDFNGQELRVVYKYLDNGERVLIQLATNRSDVTNFIQEFEIFNLITLPIILILIIIISLYVSSRVYSRLNKIIDLADQISAKHISKRIEFKANKNDVYTRLKDTLNNLFDRLENQITQISEFSNNASHQLMTPLTTIKSELDFILKKERNINEYKETLNILHDKTNDMINIVQTLLILARESDTTQYYPTVFNLNKLIKDQIATKYSDKNVFFSTSENLSVKGNAQYFAIALSNLIDNAIKYSDPNHTKVFVNINSDNENIIISVSDSGYGIPEEERHKIFDKFYRGKNTESVKGYGLGLSLVSVIIKQMMGHIEIKNNLPNGTIFIITIPAIQFQ